MRKGFFLIVFIWHMLPCVAQDSTISNDADSARTIIVSTDLNIYFLPGGERIFLPVIKLDKDWLHVEGRYNYEDLNTGSLWAGYNFEGGSKKFEYSVTPMIGGVAGQTKGFAAGLEFTLNFGRFELYHEGEYLFDSKETDNNFYYTWSDFTFSPRDWWWLGISAQRTKLYKTKLDIQRGLMAGFSTGNWEFTGYLYNLGFDDPFGLLTVTFGF